MTSITDNFQPDRESRLMPYNFYGLFFHRVVAGVVRVTTASIQLQIMV
jgi:hypothetical protein